MSPGSLRFRRHRAPKLPGWLAIFSFTQPSHLYLLFPGLFFTIISAALPPTVAVLMGKFADATTQFGGGMIDSEELRRRTKVSVYGFVVVGCISVCSNALAFITWGLFGEIQAQRVRHELFRSLLEKDLDWFEARDSGIASLLTRLQTQIRELQMGTSQPLSIALSGLVEGCMAFGLALYYNWKLTLVVLSSLPLAGLILQFLSHRIQRHIHTQHSFLATASQVASHSIVNISLIKCFDTHSYEVSRYVSAISNAAKPALRQASVSAIQTSSLAFSLMTTFVIGFWYGGRLVHDGKSTAGKVITTILTAFMAMAAFQSVVPQLLVLAKAHAAALALVDLWNTVERGQRFRKRIDGLSPDVCEGKIQLSEVSFVYPSRPDHLVLHPTTITFRAGRLTFLIGKSGSGKSTIGNLLMRFYSPRTGTVTIDGIDIQDLDTNWLRNNITLIQQETFLFNETIYRNIALGQKHYERATSQQVWECVELAALNTTIAEMPFGIDTKVGVGGRGLSGGQTQRVALARARLRNTPILMLDESTSALDSANRKVVMERIRSWRAGMTTIIISHDTSQIETTDYVYVLEDGKVIDQGPGSQLRKLLGSEACDDQLSAEPCVSLATDDLQTKHPEEAGGDKSTSQPSRAQHMRRASFERQVNDLENGTYLDTAKAMQRATRMTMFLSRGNVARANISTYNTDLATRRAHYHVPRITTEIEESTSTGHDIPLDGVLSKTTRTTMAAPSKPEQDRSLRSPRLLDRHTPKSSARFGGPAFHKLETEDEVSQMSLQTILSTVWPSLAKLQRIWVFVGTGTLCLRSAIPAVLSYSLAKIFETYYMTDDYEAKALKWCIILLATTAAEGFMNYTSGYLLDVVARTWADRLRMIALQRILAQPKAWFELEQNSSAFLTSVLDRNAEEMRVLVSRYTPKALSVLLMLTVSTVWAFVVCWKVTIVGAAAMPVIATLVKFMEIMASTWEVRIDTATDAIGAVFAETFTDIRTVRSLTLEAYFHRKYAEVTSTAFKVGRTRSIYVGILYGAVESSIHFLFAILTWYAIRLATSYEVGATELFTALSLTFLTCTQASSILSLLPMVAMAAESASRVIRLTWLKNHTRFLADSLPEVAPHSFQHVAVSTPAIEFSNVTFSYPTRPDTRILKALDIQIALNKCTAIVGHSGCGKSTIAALVSALYPYRSEIGDQTSSIKIFGRSLDTIPPPVLGALVGTVPQDPVLLPATTVWDNITYGLDPHTRLTLRANVELAAQQAAIHDFIISLPQQYDTVIGEGGLGISGGQAQRIVIARALVRRPKILILDEAMAALDAESAAEVQNALGEAMNGESEGRMTVLMITHAVETMKFADMVIMLDEGSVVEQGTFDDLVRKRGRFTTMLKLG